MTSPLTTNYSVTWASGSYTITYAGNAFAAQTFASATKVFVNHSNANYFYFGNDADGNLTLLDYTRCTAPVGASRAALITAITALDTSASTITVPVSVANGGTGATSLTAGSALFGNGTNPLTDASLSTVIYANGQFAVSSPFLLSKPLTLTDATQSTAVGTGSAILSGGLSVAKDTFHSGKVQSAANFVSTALANQFGVNTGNGLASINWAPTSSYSVTVPDSGADVFVTAAVTQTLSKKTFSDATIFSGGVQYATSGGTPSTLNFYQETTLTFGTTGALVTAGNTLKIARLGDFVTVSWPTIQGTTGSLSTLVADSSVPAQFRPLIAYDGGGHCLNNTAHAPLYASMSTLGVLTWGPASGTGGQFAGAANGGPFAGSLTYPTN